MQKAAYVRRIWRAILIDHLSENQHFAGSEDVGRSPIERSPIYAQAQIALALRCKASNRGSIERQIVPALDQKLLVVIEHVETPFKIAEQHRDSFNTLLVRQIPDAVFLYLLHGNAIAALLFGVKVKLF